MTARGLRLHLATLAPVACAIHCLATPLVVVLAPALAHGPGVERALFAASLALSGFALASGFRRHRHAVALVPALLGFILWGSALLGRPLIGRGEPAIALASVLVAAGVLWNARLVHRGEHVCECPACEP